MPRGKKELASFMGAGQVSTRAPMAQCHKLRVAPFATGIAESGPIRRTGLRCLGQAHGP